MKIEYSYRGNKVLLSDTTYNIFVNFKGEVKTNTNWSDGKHKCYTVTLEPHELLKTAQLCLKALNSIAGTDYKVV